MTHATGARVRQVPGRVRVVLKDAEGLKLATDREGEAVALRC